MINIIRVKVSFYDNPSDEMLELYSNRLITAVDDYCNNRQRSFVINPPTEERIMKGDYNYEWEIEVGDCSVNAHELFDIVNPVSFGGGKLLYVDVRDKKYDPKYNNCNVGYYWTNEGSTWYHDSETGYKDPFWEFHVNGHSDYRIIHIPTQIDKLRDERSKSFYRNSGATYMWSCVSSWDNWLQATTLEDAIEEFEQLYKKKLWQAVEGYKKSLDNAIDAFASFDKYRWNKRW